MYKIVTYLGSAEYSILDRRYSILDIDYRALLDATRYSKVL